MSTLSTPSTLFDLIAPIPSDKIAILLPEQNIKVTYGSLRAQVQAVAEQLAAAGINRGDRIATSLINGLPMIVSFLAASVVGTAAPLNPSYKEDEFKFFLDDTDARVLLLPPDGGEEARRAAGDKYPVITIDMNAAGVVSLQGVSGRKSVDLPGVDDVALVLHTSGSTGR